MSELVPAPNEPPTRIIIQPSPSAGWEEREQVRTHVKHLAWLLDSAFVIPGTKVRVGIDPLLGLIPILGDLIAMLLGGYIIMLAARVGVPRAVLARMMLNVGADALLGSVPVAGDLLDAAWRANAKNAALLERALADPKAAGRSSFWLLIGIGVLSVALLAGGIVLTIWLGRLLIRSLE